MKLVEQSYELFSNDYDIVKRIERVARICYKSEDKITEESGSKMVSALVRSQHYAMLEHADMIFRLFSFSDYMTLLSQKESLTNLTKRDYYLKFSNIDKYIVSGNIRAWLEFIEDSITNNIPVYSGIFKELFKIEVIFGNLLPEALWVEAHKITEEDLNDEEKLIHVRRTVEFVTDRGISHEIVRHRPCSFAQESTRYCNYGQGKFGREISVIKPLSFDVAYYDKGFEEMVHDAKYKVWERSTLEAEKAYFKLLDLGAKPQEARDVLPTDTKTDIAVTASLEEWSHIFDLRVLEVTGPSHPKINALMTPLYEEMCNIYKFMREEK